MQLKFAVPTSIFWNHKVTITILFGSLWLLNISNVENLRSSCQGKGNDTCQVCYVSNVHVKILIKLADRYKNVKAPTREKRGGLDFFSLHVFVILVIKVSAPVPTFPHQTEGSCAVHASLYNFPPKWSRKTSVKIRNRCLAIIFPPYTRCCAHEFKVIVR